MTEVDLAGQVVQEDQDGAADVEVDALDGDDGASGDRAELGGDVVHPDIPVSELDDGLDDSVISLQPHWQI